MSIIIYILLSTAMVLFILLMTIRFKHTTREQRKKINKEMNEPLFRDHWYEAELFNDHLN